MTDYNFGDVVLIPFPFTDQSTIKKRPAVIISSDAYNRQGPDKTSASICVRLRLIVP